MDSARLEAFSDGVFAVAITLLALDLVVAGPGHGTLAHQLADKWPSFAAYFISFLTIGIIWVNHHAIFKNLSEIDRTLLFLNLLLLFFVVSIPFATSTMASYLRQGGADSHLAAALYMGAFEGMSIAFSLIFWWSVRHEHLKVQLAPGDARRATWPESDAVRDAASPPTTSSSRHRGGTPPRTHLREWLPRRSSRPGTGRPTPTRTRGPAQLPAPAG